MSNTNTNRKPRILDLTKINPDRVNAIKNNGAGSHTFNFSHLTADNLNGFSLGFTPSALDILANRKFIVFESYYDANGARRYKPIPEQFNAKEARAIAGGSFNGSATHTRATYTLSNSLFYYKAICLTCGRVFDDFDEAKAHKCDAPRCSVCGREMHTAPEIKAGICEACATTRAGSLYDYHGRPNRSAPHFEKPRCRSYLLHIGAEIEVDGDDGNDFDPHQSARDFSDVFNRDIYKPFAQFERDGSLSYGVEVITAPATFNGYLNRFNDFNDFYQLARDNGGIFNRYNGLHFHLDKKYFEKHDDPEAVTRSAVLIDYMIYKHFDFFATICHREGDRFDYARDKSRAKTVLGASIDFNNQSHSNAVNHQNNSTIEIRIFGGHINSAGQFFGALDIVNALAKWAKNATLATAEKATPADLVKHLHDPARVLDFVRDVIPRPYHTEASDRLKNDFIKALEKRINGGKN